MRIKKISALKKGLLCTALLMVFVATAQEDELGTETVTVVRPYTPSVSDAFKIKTLPSLNDSIILQKKPIRYSIFSVPVASTFTPAKGTAASVKKVAPEKIFNSYAAVGLGNYNNALLDFYSSKDFDRGAQRLDVGLNHHSSRGEIDNTVLDTDFYNTGLDLTYSKRDRDMQWSIGGGLEHRRYNWYGLPDIGFDEATISAIDESQDYFNAQLEGKLSFEDAYLKEATLLARRFWDGIQSAENRLILNPKLEFPITEETFSLGLKLDYVDGSFENADLNNLQNNTPIAYRQFQAGVHPSLLLLRDDLKIQLGARLVYGLDAENEDSNFYIYPVVRASYSLLEEMAIVYGGVEGELQQNSYYDFSQENPYVSPTLMVMPTDRQYEAYAGLRGQLSPNLSYNLKGSYTAENFRPLFYLNPVNESRTDEKGYNYGNSFRLFYDDLKTLGVFGELEFSFNRNFSLGLNAAIYDYDTETDNPAWNLPDIEGSLFLDYQIGEQWYMGANLFYVGQREDYQAVAQVGLSPEEFPFVIRSLDAFFDANAHVGYHLNKQLSIFARFSNIANNSYQRWANFRVQGFQALAGISYKFDL